MDFRLFRNKPLESSSEQKRLISNALPDRIATGESSITRAFHTD